MELLCTSMVEQRNLYSTVVCFSSLPGWKYQGEWDIIVFRSCLKKGHHVTQSLRAKK